MGVVLRNTSFYFGTAEWSDSGTDGGSTCADDWKHVINTKDLSPLRPNFRHQSRSTNRKNAWVSFAINLNQIKQRLSFNRVKFLKSGPKPRRNNWLNGISGFDQSLAAKACQIYRFICYHFEPYGVLFDFIWKPLFAFPTVSLGCKSKKDTNNISNTYFEYFYWKCVFKSQFETERTRKRHGMIAKPKTKNLFWVGTGVLIQK